MQASWQAEWRWRGWQIKGDDTCPEMSRKVYWFHTYSSVLPHSSAFYIVYWCSKDLGFMSISSLNVSQIVVCLLHTSPVIWAPWMQETFASGLNPYSVHGMTEIEQSGLKYRFHGLFKWWRCEVSDAFHIALQPCISMCFPVTFSDSGSWLTIFFMFVNVILTCLDTISKR